MTRSIRHGFVDWLRHVGNHLSKQMMQGLSGPKIKPVPADNVNDRLVVGVDDRLPKAQVDDAVVVTKLGQHVNIGNGHSNVSYLPPFRPDRQLPPWNDAGFIALHNQLLCNHQMEVAALVRAFSKESSVRPSTPPIQVSEQ